VKIKENREVERRGQLKEKRKSACVQNQHNKMILLKKKERTSHS